MAQDDILRFFYIKYLECDYQFYSTIEIARALNIGLKSAYNQIKSLHKCNVLLVNKRKHYVGGIEYYNYGRLYILNKKALRICKKLYEVKSIDTKLQAKTCAANKSVLNNKKFDYISEVKKVNVSGTILEPKKNLPSGGVLYGK